MTPEPNEAARYGAVGVVIAALIGAWAMLREKVKSSPAQTQEQINTGFEAFMKRSDLSRADLTEQITALRGEIRNLKQYNRSLVHALVKHNIEVPVYEFLTDGVVALPGYEEDHSNAR